MSARFVPVDYVRRTASGGCRSETGWREAAHAAQLAFMFGRLEFLLALTPEWHFPRDLPHGHQPLRRSGANYAHLALGYSRQAASTKSQCRWVGYRRRRNTYGAEPGSPPRSEESSRTNPMLLRQVSFPRL